MTNVQLTQEQRELIERMGVFYEQHGIPPMEGRIMSLLIVCDEPELTFDQIRELLGISKSTTSSALNMLLLTQRVIYKTRPGDRKRYFTSNIEYLSIEFPRLYQEWSNRNTQNNSKNN